LEHFGQGSSCLYPVFKTALPLSLKGEQTKWSSSDSRWGRKPGAIRSKKCACRGSGKQLLKECASVKTRPSETSRLGKSLHLCQNELYEKKKKKAKKNHTGNGLSKVFTVSAKSKGGQRDKERKGERRAKVEMQRRASG